MSDELSGTLAKVATFARIEFEALRNCIKPKPTEDDPVLDGLIRDFKKFGDSLKSLYDAIEKFTWSLDESCHGTMSMIETFSKCLSKSGAYIASDVIKYKEACNNITREDAPFSTIAKFKRDLNFNVIEPLRKHVGHYHVLLDRIDRRQRLLAELKLCRDSLETHVGGNMEKLSRADFEKVSALFNDFKSAEKVFEKENSNILEWMLMIQTYKEDIYDSLIQTMKCLQYEFFAGAARNVASVLPQKMEFRPLMEMTPENLLPQVQITMMARAEKTKLRGDKKFQTTTRILEFMQSDSEVDERDDETTAETGNLSRQVPVDELSVSLLTAQGFDEELGRKALKANNNDLQAALDWILNPPSTSLDPLVETGNVRTSVRYPKTGKLMEKLRAYEERRRARAGSVHTETETGKSTDTDEDVQVMKQVHMEALLSDQVSSPAPRTKEGRRKKHTHKRHVSSSEGIISLSESTSSKDEEPRRRQRRDRRQKDSEPLPPTPNKKMPRSREKRREARKGSRRHIASRKTKYSRRRGLISSSRSSSSASSNSSSEEISKKPQHLGLEQQSPNRKEPLSARDFYSREQQRIEKEAAGIRSRLPKRSSLRQSEGVSLNAGTMPRVFQPSPLPAMLAELLPIGGQAASSTKSREKDKEMTDDGRRAATSPPSGASAEHVSQVVDEFRDLLADHISSVSSSSVESGETSQV